MNMEPAPPLKLSTSKFLPYEVEPAQSSSSSMVDNNMESAPPPYRSTSVKGPVQSSNAAMVDSERESAMPPHRSTTEVQPVTSAISPMVDSDMEPAQSVHFSVADIVSVSKSPWRMEWFLALHEEDCLKIRKLLHKDPRLVIVHPEEAERQTLDRMRFGWRGCTALHVAVKKGWSLLVEEILDKFEYIDAGIGSVITDETSKGSWDPSIELKNLLLVLDGDCQLDALGIAIASFNMKIVSLLTDAFRKCKYDDPYGLKHRTYNVSSVGIWTRRGDELVIDREALRKMISLGDLAHYETWPDGEQQKEIAKQFIDRLIDDEEEESRREKLREISRGFIDNFVDDAAAELQNRKLLLKITSEFMKDPAKERLTKFFKTHTDFNFLPIEIYLFHALCASEEFSSQLSVLGRIIFRKGESLFISVFERRDAQGRTPLHVAVDYDNLTSVLGIIIPKPNERERERSDPERTRRLDWRCINAHDSVGRTALQRAAMLESPVHIGHGVLDGENWRPPLDRHFYHYYEEVLLRNGYSRIPAVYGWTRAMSTADIACVSVNVPILRQLQEFDNDEKIASYVSFMQAIAAASGDMIKVAALRATGRFDARVEDRGGNNLLHFALNPSSDFGKEAIKLPNLDLVHLNPMRCAVQVFNCRVSDRNRVRRSSVSRSPTSSVQSDKGRQACINLLLEAGVDAFHRNKRGLLPDVGTEASPEMRLWWSERVAKVTREMNNSLALAANAITVTAALVATASFIGPLQPPSGYVTDSAGVNKSVHLEILMVRIFLITNTLAFYLALGAIMLSLIPALPFPNESMEDERKRSRFTVVIATSHLMASMLLILAAFTAASIAVSSDGGHHERFTKPLFISGGVFSAFISWWCCGRIFGLFSLLYKAGIFPKMPSVLRSLRHSIPEWTDYRAIQFFLKATFYVGFVLFVFVYGLLSSIWLLFMVAFNRLNYREIYRNPYFLTKDTLWAEILH